MLCVAPTATPIIQERSSAFKNTRLTPLQIQIRVSAAFLQAADVYYYYAFYENILKKKHVKERIVFDCADFFLKMQC